MNVILEKLFEKYNLGEKDRYEINQIYDFLTPEKKIKLVENFEGIVWHIQVLKQDMFAEQEILFGKTLQGIEERIRQAKQNQIRHNAESEISNLRKFILE